MSNEPLFSDPILVAGFGSAGRRHFRNLWSLGYRNFVFLRSGQGVLDDAEISGFPSTDKLETAIAYQPKVAVVATPSSLHLGVALPLVEAGCDLYIEKPLSDNMDSIDRLLAVVLAQKRVAMVGCQFRFHPLLRALHSMVLEGRPGEVVGASAEYGDYLPAWHPWEDHRRSYSARPEMGGGVILTLIHPLDYLYMLFGASRSVTAVTRRISSLDTAAGEDWSDINIVFTSGIVAHVHIDYLQRPPVHRLNVIGETGRLLCDFNAGELTWQPAEGEISIYRVPPDFGRNTMFLDAMRHFLDCVGTRREPRIPLADGVAVLKMAVEARRATVA